MRPQNILYASIFAAGLGFSSAACAANAVVISVDKTSQRMTVSVDGATRYVWPVSTGRPGFDTPNGTFHPFRLDQDHHSTVYDNAPMPDSIFFTKTGDAVHGFFDTPHLGMAVSHGCVRLSPANAAVLYGLVEQTGLSDTTVVVHGSIPTRNATTVARRRTAAPKQQFAEERTPGIVEHDQLAIEHDPLGQLIKNLLEPPHPVAAARDRPATTL
jgi:hypothetical protein